MKKLKNLFYKVVDSQEGFSSNQKVWIKKYGIEIGNIISGVMIFILKFIILVNIFIKGMYPTLGFELTLLYMFALYIVLTKINLKSLINRN